MHTLAGGRFGFKRAAKPQLVVNVFSCEPDETFGRGAFHARLFDLSERVGAAAIRATMYELGPGAKLGPYHYHHGVEEWLYVVSGAPTLRDVDGERLLEPGQLVGSPPDRLALTRLTGRVVMFSAGDRGWERQTRSGSLNRRRFMLPRLRVDRGATAPRCVASSGGARG